MSKASSSNVTLESDKLFEGIASGEVLLLTGKDSYKQSGARAILDPLLEDRIVRVVSDFGGNHQIGEVERLVSDYKDYEFAMIIAVGGGSVIDMAKLFKAFHARPSKIRESITSKEKIVPSETPIVAIPTTYGSGSEVTHFAVVYDGNTKYSVAHKALLPSKYFLLPELTRSLPQKVAASAALDALSQGIESFWSIYSTEKSKELAREAISLIKSNILDAVVERIPEAQRMMMRASNLAGKAINITKTTAAHSVSYAFTALYNIPHGHAVALILPSFFSFNENVNEKDILDLRGEQYVKANLSELNTLIGCESASQAANWFSTLVSNLGLATQLKELGIESEEQIENIIVYGFNPDRVNNNPRRLDKNDLREMLGSI